MTARRPNPAVKRLRWVAERYPTDVLMLTADALAEALGMHTTFIVTDAVTWGGSRLAIPVHDAPSLEELHALILRRAQGELPKHTRYDRYLPWLAREIDRLRADYFAGRLPRADDPSYGIPKASPEFPGGIDPRWWMWGGPGARAQELRNRFRGVVDWAEAEKVDLNRYRYEEAFDEAEDWAKLREIGDMPQGSVVYRFDDGWTVQQLSTQEQLDAEGDVMQHCVENYEAGETESVREGVTSYDGRKVWIYSLRDPKGLPHSTLEFDIEDSYVSQLRGKQNDVPKPEYLERLVGFRTAILDPIVAERGFGPVLPPANYDQFGKSPLVAAYSVRGAYGAKPDAVMLVYKDAAVRGDAEVYMPEKVDAALDKLQQEFDQWWDTTDWDPPRRDLTDEEFYEWEQEAMRESFQETLSGTNLGETGENSEPYAPLFWLVLRDHGLVLDDTPDEMVNWMTEQQKWSPVCRFLGQRAANPVAELRDRLMPPRAW